MKIGYARVSTAEQNEARQIQLLQEQGAEKIFIDKMSGKNTARPQLNEMLSFVRDGDSVVVESISRLARNTRDFLELVDQMRDKHVKFISVKESIDTESVSGKFMLTVFSAMAEMERDYILDRQREGIEIARQQGKYTGRAPIDIDEDKFKAVCLLWRSGEITAVEAQKRLNLKPNTFYRRVQKFNY